MTKADLIEEVSRLAEVTRKDSEVIVETIFDSIVRSLRVGDKIEIRGFGSFRTRQRKPRVGRNPKTGDRVEVPAKKIPFFKPGYYRYAFVDARKELEAAAAQLRGLAALSGRSGVHMGFHNHAGYIGGGIWDIAPAIDGLDPKAVGYYFDVRHAVVEGGDGGWRTAFSVVSPRLSMIALKDFFWEKTATGWRQQNCPMGEGMVNWKAYFGMLAKAGFHGPVSLHLEYQVPGATPQAVEDNTITAATKDLAFVKAGLAEAYKA